MHPPESPAPAARPAPAPIAPGLLVLQGNRLEDLLDVLLQWLAAHPLGPLEEEVLLVQSNGIAEWLKMLLARHAGVCAATRVDLPARFLWRCYRAMLGRAGAPAHSPLDEGPLVWRLMRLLPVLATRSGYEPLARFLDGPEHILSGGDTPVRPLTPERAPDLARRLQLAQRLADLYDQYQVYRADWLADWTDGRPVLAQPHRSGPAQPVPDEQRWQVSLWQALVEDVRSAASDGADPLSGTRPQVHRRFVDAVLRGEAPQRHLPRRVVLFGHSHLPGQTLEALAALARRAQVILAVPNPCRYHWADMIDGRELLAAARRRLPLRGGRDLASVPLEDAHAQSHPLLAAWGRQGRDFLRLLDDFEARHEGEHPDASLLRGQLPRVDLFDDAPGATLLAQVQARIRDAVPLAEHAAIQELALDDSLRFHVCHGAMRELEVLHDTLLQRLADGTRPLAPRDIVVMLPDIEAAAPLIHAVFGQHAPGDARRIPYEIADLRPRGRHPLLLALEWLLRIPAQRCTAGELRELVEVPALARRFGLSDDDRSVLVRWLAESGVRWGLNAEHRASLELAACGEVNTWSFGLRRMLLGYAAGPVDDEQAVDGADDLGVPWRGIEPYAEVAGLQAGIAGSLAALLDALTAWWQLGREPAPPAEWERRARALLARCFDARDDDERALVQALHDALAAWLAQCEESGYAEAVPLAVLREAWLGGVAEPGLRSRFLSGGVTFCTLMPMRAIPFRCVALLGMNDGDYPRRAPRSDFDLMALPGQRRPGDRARRDDDRMLMLEALLSAREHLLVSWVGRSVRDQSAQPPSVLVGQLRDYLKAGWGEALLEAITVEHPLQPFSRRYFEQPGPLFTHAAEWRAIHVPPAAGSGVEASMAQAPGVGGASGSGAEASPPDDAEPLTLARLGAFVRNPVADHLKHQLGVVFDSAEEGVADDEPMALDALEQSIALRELVERTRRQLPVAAAEDGGASGDEAALAAALDRSAARLQRQGRLPLASLGPRWRRRFVDDSLPMAQAWRAAVAAAPERAPPQALRHEAVARAGKGPVRVVDWLDGLRVDADGGLLWTGLVSSKLCKTPTKSDEKKEANGQPPVVRPDKCIDVWLAMLLGGVAGLPLRGVLVGRDAVLELRPPDPEAARVALEDLLASWARSAGAPLPVAPRAAMAAIASLLDEGWNFESEAWPAEGWQAAESTYDGRSWNRGAWAERDDPALARLYPDAEALLADAEGFRCAAEAIYRPLVEWTRDPERVRARRHAKRQAATDLLHLSDAAGGTDDEGDA